MSTVNVWLALSQTALDIIKPLLRDDEYDGEHLTAVKIFRKMQDSATRQAMFKTPTIGGKVWTLFSVELDGTAKTKNALDYLVENYGNNVSILGAWWFDGLQVGTSLDEEGNVTGTPVYPVHARLIDFMPDVVAYDEDGNEVGRVPATENIDVNVIQGQSPRSFD